MHKKGTSQRDRKEPSDGDSIVIIITDTEVMVDTVGMVVASEEALVAMADMADTASTDRRGSLAWVSKIRQKVTIFKSNL